MEFKCERIDLQLQHALSIRTRTTTAALPEALGKAYGSIGQHLNELGEAPAGAPFVAYYNMDMSDLDVEIGIPVAKPLAGKGDIAPGEIPAGQYASGVFTGPYSELEPAYNTLFAWVEEQGYEVTGVAYELYISDPGETPPAELKTQILFPLKGSA